MGKKQYTQGMADAMEAYEQFGKKQEEAIRHVGNQVEQTTTKVDKLGEKIGGITSYITDRERAELYKLNTPVDIADLDNAEKRLLLAILYQLADVEEDITEAQQNYVRAVQQYLKIYNPQTVIALDAVENIEDISATKAILQAALELFYLGSHPGTYSEDQMDFLDCFQVNRKTRKEIIGHIEAILDVVGLQGLSEKYGVVAQQPKSEFATYKDNGPIPEKVADSCIDLIDTGGLCPFRDGPFFWELQDFLVFCKEVEVECNGGDQETTYLKLFRINKRTGQIDQFPFDFEKDLKFKINRFMGCVLPNLSYHIQENMLYIIENGRDYEKEDGIKYVQLIGINVEKLTYRLLPLTFQPISPRRFPRFHLSGDTTHLVVYAYTLNGMENKPTFIQTNIVDLVQERVFLIEPDMIVRDAFWWDGSLMLLGRYKDEVSIFRYNIQEKSVTNFFNGPYKSAFTGLPTPYSHGWWNEYGQDFLIKRMDCIDEKFYFLIQNVHTQSYFKAEDISLYTFRFWKSDAYLDCCLSRKHKDTGVGVFQFLQDGVLLYEFPPYNLKKYTYSTGENTIIDDKGICYIVLGDYLYKRLDSIWYKTNISDGTDSLQWERYIPSEG